MASIYKEIVTKCPAAAAWDAVRDVGQLHTRLVPGFVADVKLEPGARIVTFGNGMTAKELIVSIDEERRRVVWSAVGGRLSHHNAAVQVFEQASGARIVWTADLLPNELAPAIESMIGQGIAVMKRTLDAAA
jgi:carbon monoxide dehydrogenase subunit G